MMGDLDPSRHLLRHSLVPREVEPTLDRAAEVIRAVLKVDIAPEASLRRQPVGDTVVMAPGRATIIAELLEELALRLRTDHAVGPIQSDGSLSRLVKELATDMGRRAGLPTLP